MDLKIKYLFGFLIVVGGLAIMAGHIPGVKPGTAGRPGGATRKGWTDSDWDQPGSNSTSPDAVDVFGRPICLVSKNGKPLFCPHPEFLRKHTEIWGHTVLDALWHTWIWRWYDNIDANTVIFGDNNYQVNEYGECEIVQWRPVYQCEKVYTHWGSFWRAWLHADFCRLQHHRQHGHLQGVTCREPLIAPPARPFWFDVPDGAVPRR